MKLDDLNSKQSTEKLEPIESVTSALSNAYNIPKERLHEFTEIMEEVHPYFSHLLYKYKVQRYEYYEVQEYFKNKIPINLIDADILSFENLIARFKGESKIDRRKLFKRGFLKAVLYRVKSRSFTDLFSKEDLPFIQTEEERQVEEIISLEDDPSVTNYIKHLALELNLPRSIKNTLIAYYSAEVESKSNLKHINLNIYLSENFNFSNVNITKIYFIIKKLISEYYSRSKTNRIIIDSLIASENIYYLYLLNQKKQLDSIALYSGDLKTILDEYNLSYLLTWDLKSIRNKIPEIEPVIFNEILEKFELRESHPENYRIYRIFIEHQHNLTSLQYIDISDTFGGSTLDSDYLYELIYEES